MRLASAFATTLVGPGGRSCLPTILDHPRALAQRDWGAGPTFTGGVVGGERNLIILDAGDVLDDAFPVRCPRINAECEVRSKRRGHLIPPSRFTAGACDAVAEVRGLGFPGAWVKHSPPKRLRNPSAVAASGKQNRI